MQKNSDTEKFTDPNPRIILPIRTILPITSIGVFMAAMDGSIVNVSLLTIATSLSTDMAGIRWIVLIYLLTMSALMGLAGSLGDTYGRKVVFQIGMSFFILGSLLSGISTSLFFLIGSRIVQAIGAAGMMANGLGLVMTYVDPNKRGRAIGINSFVVAAALSTGPVLGGILTESIGWPSIFLINVPIGAIGIILVQRIIPETERSSNSQFDFIGVALFAAATFSLISGITFTFDGVSIGVVLLLISIATFLLFLYHENNHPHPMMSLKLLKNRKIATGALSALLCYMGINGVFFLFPFFYQEVLLLSQSQTGILLIVSPIVMSFTGPIAGFLSEKIDTRMLATGGAILELFFIMCLSLISSEMSLPVILSLVGFSAGSLAIFTNSNGTSVMNIAPRKDLSIVSGILNLSRTIGFSIGTALSTALFGLFFGMNSLTNIDYNSTYYHSLGGTFIILGLIVGIGAIISYARGPERKIAPT